MPFPEGLVTILASKWMFHVKHFICIKYVLRRAGFLSENDCCYISGIEKYSFTQWWYLCSIIDVSTVIIQRSLDPRLDWIIMLYFFWIFFQSIPAFGYVILYYWICMSRKFIFQNSYHFRYKCNYYYSYKLNATPSTIQ